MSLGENQAAHFERLLRAVEQERDALRLLTSELLDALRLCRAIICCGSRGARIRAEPEAIAKAEAAIAKAEAVR